MPTEPPTERQLNYAKGLGILIPDGATKSDVSNLIDMTLDRDKSATDRHKNLAKIFGVVAPRFIGKKALFDLIQYNLIKPGREKEMLSWFTYRVYRELVNGADDATISSPNDLIIQKIAGQLESDEAVIKSVRRYTGRDLIWFGEWTSPKGEVFTGGSNRTAAYKKISGLLKQYLGSAGRSIKRQPKLSEQPKPIGTLTGLLKGLGWGILILIGFLLLIEHQR